MIIVYQNPGFFEYENFEEKTIIQNRNKSEVKYIANIKLI